MGSSRAQLKTLCNCGLGEKGVYILDRAKASVRSPAPLELKWPIEFLLRQNKKHVFVRPVAQTSRGSVSRALARWERRYRWRVFFSLADGDNDRSYAFMRRGCAEGTAQCHTRLPLQFELFISDVRATVLEKCQTARARGRGKFTQQFPPLVRWCMEVMAKSTWGAIPTDKDGGFCVAPKLELLQARMCVLNGPFYEEHIRTLSLEQDTWFDFTKLVDEHVSHDPALRRALLQEAGRAGLQGLVAMLIINMKRHRAPGNVVPRGIHSSLRSPLLPAMRYIANRLRAKLYSMPHLINNSAAVVEGFRTMPIPEDATLYKADVAVFHVWQSPGYHRSGHALLCGGR